MAVGSAINGNQTAEKMEASHKIHEKIVRATRELEPQRQIWRSNVPENQQDLSPPLVIEDKYDMVLRNDPKDKKGKLHAYERGKGTDTACVFPMPVELSDRHIWQAVHLLTPSVRAGWFKNDFSGEGEIRATRRPRGGPVTLQGHGNNYIAVFGEYYCLMGQDMSREFY